MNLERRLADNMIGTDRDAFPARLALVRIQANESCRLMPDERTVQFHEMSPMILLEDGIGLSYQTLASGPGKAQKVAH
jgi:hypothetical protein